jgi:hypothetical protein
MIAEEAEQDKDKDKDKDKEGVGLLISSDDSSCIGK